MWSTVIPRMAGKSTIGLSTQKEMRFIMLRGSEFRLLDAKYTARFSHVLIAFVQLSKVG